MEPHEISAVNSFNADMDRLAAAHNAPLTPEMRDTIWTMTQQSGQDYAAAERSFHAVATSVFGPPVSAPIPDDEPYEDEYDEYEDDPVPEPDRHAGQLDAAREQVGRPLTRAEQARLTEALDGDWQDFDKVLADVGVKDFSQMSREEKDGWTASRVQELTPEADVEFPAAEDRSPDEWNSYMALRAQGHEFEPVTEDA
jgi:hypothetical protein